MFLPWTLFFVNLILVTTRFLVVTAVGAILAIYSRLRGEHANSIRWVRQGGYLEMFSFLINTRKEITMQAKAALLFTIVATFTAGIAGRGAVRFVLPTTRQSIPGFVTMTTKQYMPVTDPGTICGWSNSIYRGEDIVEIMTSMISDTKITKIIPDAVIGRVYTPQTFDYEIECNTFDVSVDLGGGSFVLGDSGCAQVHLTITGPFDYLGHGVVVTNRSASRWSISIPSIYAGFVSDLSVIARTVHNNLTCGVTDIAVGILWVPENGSNSLPSTQATKCVFPSGDITSSTMSVARFISTTIQQFSNISKTIFEEYDELFQAMGINLSNNSTKGNSTLFTEIKSENGSTNALSCLTAPSPDPLANNTEYLTCVYIMFNSIVLEKQTINSTIVAAQGGPLPTPPELTSIMSFTHPTSVDMGYPLQISISDLMNLTSAASQYLASLGQNLFVNWDKELVTVMFNTTDAEEGLEIPLWLIICVPIVAIVCAVLLGTTEYFLDGRYTGSLYKAIATPMRSRMKSFAPMLMKSRVGPVEFEGIPVVPSSRRFERDSKNVATIQSDGNPDMTVVSGKHSSFL